MSLVETLRTTTESLGWKFYYGRRDFLNLIESDSSDDSSLYFFLDPVKREPLYSDTGSNINETIYLGRFMMLSKSELDQEYDKQTGERVVDQGKWKRHIEPKIKLLFGDFENKIQCIDELQIMSYSIIDVINMFDTNFDGILVNYRIKEFG